MKTYYVYILTTWNNKVLYIGITNNLERRVFEHKSGKVAGFTQKYYVTKLVYFEDTNDVTAAISREKQLKGWLRKKKIELIENINPEWKDLSSGWYEEDPSLALRMTTL